MHIFFRQYSVFCWHTPIDAKRRVVPSYCSFALRCVVIIAFILKNSLIAQHCKTMCEATRNEKLTMIIFSKFNGYMLPKRWRTFTDVNCYIEHSTSHYTHKFALRKWWLLKMQTTHNTSYRTTLVVLHKSCAAHFLFKFSLRK